MSGAEAVTVVGLISSVITIIETSTTFYNAAKNSAGLHEAFRTVAQNIPLVLNILHDCRTVQNDLNEQSKTASDANYKRELDESAQAVKPVMQKCEENAQKLRDIFAKVVPGEDAGWLERYHKAAKSIMPGKKQKVEDLMKEILAKLQLLQTSHFFKEQVEKRSKQLEAAISQISALEPSLPEDEGRFVHTGSGALYAHTGSGVQNNYNQSGGEKNKQYIGHTMNFGRDSP